MTRIAFSAIAALILAGCSPLSVVFGGQIVKGSGKVKTETRQVGAFKSVALEGSTDCEVTVGPKESVTVTADDNIVGLIKTEVVNGTLKIRSKGSFSTHRGITVKVTMPSIENFDLAGSGDAVIKGVNGGNVALSLAGSGDITASGSASSLHASIAGSGDMKLKALKVGSADVSIAGSGSVEVSPTKSLSASIAGSGDVVYYGDPQIERSVVGSGDVRRG